jgi:hypothetical protein
LLGDVRKRILLFSREFGTVVECSRYPIHRWWWEELFLSLRKAAVI